MNAEKDCGLEYFTKITFLNFLSKFSKYFERCQNNFELSKNAWLGEVKRRCKITQGA